jgi:hypothetical protein
MTTKLVMADLIRHPAFGAPTWVPDQVRGHDELRTKNFLESLDA